VHSFKQIAPNIRIYKFQFKTNINFLPYNLPITNEMLTFAANFIFTLTPIAFIKQSLIVLGDKLSTLLWLEKESQLMASDELAR